MNSKPEILSKSDEDEDDFAVVYSRLVRVLRRDIPFTIVFPLAIRLMKNVPPQKLDAYTSLSKWSCYKTGGDITSSWIELGEELLQEATDEQYRVKEVETHTETTRRERTVARQDLADTAMKQYSKSSNMQKLSDKEKLRMQMEIAKNEAIREEAIKWKEREEKRAIAAAEEKERLLRAKEAHGYKKKGYIYSEFDFAYWSIVIGGTAITGAIIAIMMGYVNRGTN